MESSRARTKTGGRPASQGVIPGDYALSVGRPDKPAPKGWSWTTLTDVARLESGHTPSRKHPEYWGGDVPWIGIKDATENHGRIIEDTFQHTNELGISNSSARILPANTVCLSRTASVGYVVVMGRPMATSQDFVNWVCSDAIDYRYLKYVLLSERAAFMRFASGTTHQTIYFPEVKAFHVCLPPLAEQRNIVHILGTLDDKIELNRKRNQVLEVMARALFQDWFVDFGPVYAKMEGRAPYLPPEIWSLFPDCLDGEGKPEGWEPGSLSDFAKLNPESWTKKNTPVEIEYVDLANTKQGMIESTVRLPWSEAPSRAQRILREGDTIVGTVRPGNGSYALISSEGLTGSTGFAVLRPKQQTFRDFVYLAATSQENIERLAHLADGAAYPAVRPDIVIATPIFKPSSKMLDSILKAFAESVCFYINSIEHNKRESHSLTDLRDILLPKLISGELRIKTVGTVSSESEASKQIMSSVI